MTTTDRTCVVCSSVFQIEKKRGRPAVKCEDCRTSKKPKAKAKRVIEPRAHELMPSDISPKPRAAKGKGNRLYSRVALVERLESIERRLSPSEISDLIKELP